MAPLQLFASLVPILSVLLLLVVMRLPATRAMPLSLLATGALAVISNGFSGISCDHRVQVIIIAWLFGAQGSFVAGSSTFSKLQCGGLDWLVASQLIQTVWFWDYKNCCYQLCPELSDIFHLL